jgi:hypothetical protein
MGRHPHLTRVFETDLYVATNDLTGKLLVAPLSGRARDELRRQQSAQQ